MVIYGARPVQEVLQNAANALRELIVDDERKATELGADVRVRIVDTAKLDEICEGGNHQGIAAEVIDFPYTSLAAIRDATRDRGRACVLVLDQVQDPQNLGTILRTAAAFGVDGVLIGKDRSAQVTPAVIRASAGLAYRVPVARVTNTSRALEELKEAGFWTVGAVMADAQPPWAIDFDMKTALVMGAEGSGIRRLVAQNCDFRVEIPMAEGVDSLNVASSTAVLLYEIARSAGQG